MFFLSTLYFRFFSYLCIHIINPHCSMEIEKIAIFHSPFGSKFGIPKQSGIVPELRGEIVLEKAYRNPDALRGIEDLTICGSCGASRPTVMRLPASPCGLHALAAMSGWVSLPVAVLSDRMVSGCRRYASTMSTGTRRAVRCSMCSVRI